MKKQARIFPILLYMIFLSCQESGEPTAIYVQTIIGIKVLNSEGINLLNPANHENINQSSIKIYYREDDELKEFYNPNLDWPRNFKVYKEEITGEFKMKLSLEEETVINWGDGSFDTIKSEFHRTSGNGTRLIKVWFKGDLVYDVETATTNPELTIVK